MPSIKEFETWLTSTEAAEQIGISRQGLHRHLEKPPPARGIKAARTHFGWLLDPKSVEAFKERRDAKMKGER